MNSKPVGEVIKEEIDRQGRNMKEVALSAGVPYTTLYALCTRKSLGANMKTLSKIAKELGVGNEIFYGQENSEMSTYTIWKNNWPIGEIQLFQWQAEMANKENRNLFFSQSQRTEEEME